MCGIAGFVSTRRLDGNAMVRSLRHRGPDANGSYEITFADKKVFLGHTRLSIIDLSAAGQQPMFAAEGKIALVFNGEIYNFRQLRAQHLPAVQFRSHTDTEVLLRLYERMGLSCLERLNGDFAIAIFDADAGKLYLIRDRIGVKPLYYYEGGEGLVFGSEIKAILAAGVRPELAAGNLQKYFVFKYVPGDGTLFCRIRRLPPAHYLEYDVASGRSAIRRFWDFDTEARWESDYAAAKQAVFDVISDATEMRLVADVPVGTYLSGGLDSSIIAFLLKGNRQISHYCARQQESDTRAEGTTSDYYYAKRLADDWNLTLRAVDIGAVNLTRGQIVTTAYFADDLIADAAQIPSYLITRGAAASSKVFLSGMGADELFLGYFGHLLTLLASYEEKLPLPAALLRRLARTDQARGSFKPVRRYLYRLGKYAAYPAYRHAIFSIVGDFENSLAVVNGDAAEVINCLASYFPDGVAPFDCFKRFEYDNFLQKNLAYVDRTSMANSVEVRVPFLDHRLLELAYSLPRSYKLSALGRTKRILKDAFAPHLPAYIRRRRKAGFGMPIRSIFSSREKISELLDLDYLARIAPFNVPHIRNLIDQHLAGHEDNSSIIYALISYEAWYREYLDGGHASSVRLSASRDAHG